MNWPPDQLRLSVLMEGWNHALGLAIRLSVSNPLRKLQESMCHFFICSPLCLEETELKVAEHTKEHDRVKRARWRKLEVLRRPRISAPCPRGMNRNE